MTDPPEDERPSVDELLAGIPTDEHDTPTPSLDAERRISHGRWRWAAVIDILRRTARRSARGR